ncbi:MAG TPA: hypothetical protein VGE59_00470 [Patescibacteria group bacterium]
MGHTYPPIIIVSGAVGSGKGTVIHALAHELGLEWVPTHTTRAHRPDDETLSRHVFDTEPTFLRHLARNEYLETIEYKGERYGLLREDLTQALKINKPVIIELSVEGGIKIARQYPQVLLIFISTSEEFRTTVTRNQQSRKADLKHSAGEKRKAFEHYDYIIENVEHYPNQAIDAIKDIITTHFPELKKKGII